MKKSYIYNSTIAAAQNVLEAVQHNEIPDMNSWAKWTGSLLRYVFCDYNQRIKAQDLENLLRDAYTNPENIENIIPQFISGAQDISYHDGTIQYEIPFDNRTYFYYETNT